MNGTALPKETMMRKSPDSSPEVPNPKRARVDLIEDTSDNVVNTLSDKTKSLKAQTAQMKAYNSRVEDISVEPVKAVTHDNRRDCGKDIIERVRRFMEEGWGTKVDNVMTSAYSQSLRDNANLLVMTKDVRSIKPTGQQISGDKQESASQGLNTSSSSSQQVNHSDDGGGYNEPGPPLVTKEQRDKSLKLCKEALIRSNGYAPRLNHPKEEHLRNINFLIGAMLAFRNANLKGMRAHTWEHGRYCYILQGR
jgi:hypothetical protein